MKKSITAMLAIVVALGTIGIASAADNELTPKEKKDGWILLFNGKDYTGWIGNNDKPIASAVEDGAMQTFQQGSYVAMTKESYGDFVLKCDVKMDDPCNSGIFLRVEVPANPVHTGFEIQVATGDGTGCHDFGALYDLVETTENAGLPAGEWNAVEIRACGPNISIKVNGKVVCKANLDDFDEPGKRSIDGQHKYKLDGKSRTVKDFARSGKLGFQDHGHKCWYKNVKLLPLKDCEK